MKLLAVLALTSSVAAAERFEFSDDCFSDTRTDLTWQKQTADVDLSAAYFWHNSDESANGGYAGYTSFGGQFAVCQLDSLQCNSESFVQYHNSNATCGRTTWRLPTKRELQSLVTFDRVPPATHDELKAFTQSTKYMTADTVISHHESVWAIDFKSGQPSSNHKRHPIALRLVSTDEFVAEQVDSAATAVQ